MTTNFLPLSTLTDEELLGRVYISNPVDPMILELAARLQHALDELHKPPPKLTDFWVEGRDGNGP